jgi:hypothetical protein
MRGKIHRWDEVIVSVPPQSPEALRKIGVIAMSVAP